MKTKDRDKIYRLMTDKEEIDSLHGKLTFCYVLIAGLLITIIALLYLWPN